MKSIFLIFSLLLLSISTFAQKYHSDVFEIDDLTKISGLHTANNSRIIYRPTGAIYLVQANAVSGYTTDNIAVITLAEGNYAVLQDRGGHVNIEDFGVVIGTGQTITTQKDNFVKFKRAVLWQQLKDVDLYFPEGTLEIFPTFGNEINISENENVRWFGKGRDKTFIDIKPEWPVAENKGLSGFFNTTHQFDFLVQDMSFLGYNNKTGYETYPSVLKYGSDNTKVKIQEGVQIRSGFWSELTVGDTLWYQKYNQAAFHMTSVAAKDSATKVITLTDAITDGTITNNDSSATSYIWFYWDIHSNPDTVPLYNKIFVLGLNSSSVAFNFNPGQSVYDRTGEIKFKNVYFEKFVGAVNKSGGGEDLIFDNCYVYQTISSGISVFPGEYPNPSKLILINTTVDSCASNMDGTGGPNSGGYGHNLYIHPNVPMEWHNSKSIRSNGYALHVYSGSGNKPPAPGARTIIDNSYFADSDEPIIFNWDIPTIVTNSTFKNTGGQVWMANNTEFNNCTFDAVALTCNGTYDPPNSIEGEVLITIRNCNFLNSARIAKIGWGTSASPDPVDKKVQVIVKDCYFDIIANTDEAIISGEANSSSLYEYPRLVVDNVKINANGHYFRFMKDFQSADISRVKIINPISNSSSIFRSLATYNPVPYKIKVRDSDLTGITAFSVFDNGSDVESDITTYNTKFAVTSRSKGIAKIESFYHAAKRTNVTSNTLLVSTSYDTYVISNTTDIRSITYDSLYAGSIGNVKLRIVCASDSIRLIPFSSITTSNLVGDTVVIYKGDQIDLQFVPYPLGTALNKDTIQVGIGNGSTTIYYSAYPNSGVPTYKKLPGSVSIEGSTSGVLGYDNNDNIVTGTNITRGKVSYMSNRYYIHFTSAPASGDTIRIVYDKYDTQYHAGYWKMPDSKKNTSISLTDIVGTANKIAQYGTSGVLEASEITRDSANAFYTTANKIMSSGSVVPNPLGSQYGGTITPVTSMISNANGAVEITLPIVPTNGDIYYNMEVIIYGGNTIYTEKYELTGYLLSSPSPGGSQYGGTVESNFGSRVVRYGTDGTNVKIWIGELTSSLNTRVISITRFTAYDWITPFATDLKSLSKGITLSVESTAFNSIIRSVWPSPKCNYCVEYSTTNTAVYNIGQSAYLGSFTGAMEIKVPVALKNKYVSIDFDVVSRDFNNKITVSGFINSSGAWTNAAVNSNGQNKSIGYTVRLGNDGTNPYIWVGELTGESYVFSALWLRKLTVTGSGSKAYDQPYLNAASDAFAISTETSAFNTVNLTFDTRTYTGNSIINGSQSIGTTSAPNAALALDVVSTTKGFAPPRMTAAQLSAISSPPDGSTVYNTDDDHLWLRSDGAWSRLRLERDDYIRLSQPAAPNDTFELTTAFHTLDNMDAGFGSYWSVTNGVATYTGPTEYFQIHFDGVLEYNDTNLQVFISVFVNDGSETETYAQGIGYTTTSGEFTSFGGNDVVQLSSGDQVYFKAKVDTGTALMSLTKLSCTITRL